jgi:hypothetical protein
MGVRRRRAATICAAALAAGCAGGSDGLRVSPADVDPAGGYWAIRAPCEGGDLDVEFRPGEQLAVPGFGHASDDEIAVECGEPVRVTVTDEELRRRKPTGADLAAPTVDATELSCLPEGRVVVWAHPVWAQSTVAGGALRIERGGHTLLRGAVGREGSGLPSELRWWWAVCRR